MPQLTLIVLSHTPFHLFIPDGDVAQPRVAAPRQAVLKRLNFFLIQKLCSQFLRVVCTDDCLIADLKVLEAMAAAKVVGYPPLLADEVLASLPKLGTLQVVEVSHGRSHRGVQAKEYT